jgi:hypothetical protein
MNYSPQNKKKVRCILTKVQEGRETEGTVFPVPRRQLFGKGLGYAECFCKHLCYYQLYYILILV